MQSFKVAKYRSKARYEFSCCQANVAVLDSSNARVSGSGSYYTGKTSGWSLNVYDFNVDNYLQKLYFSCPRNIPKGFLQYFVYRYWRTRPDIWSSNKFHSRYDVTCARLGTHFDEECVKMRSSLSTSAHDMNPLINLKVDCRNGKKENDEKIGDGMRRFLKGVKFEKRNGRFRYLFECCRIKKK